MENNEIVPPEEPSDGQAFHQAVASLFGCWDGEPLEPLDAPLDALGPIL